MSGDRRCLIVCCCSGLAVRCALQYMRAVYSTVSSDATCASEERKDEKEEKKKHNAKVFGAHVEGMRVPVRPYYQRV